MVELARVGYDVQPAAAPPPSTKKLASIMPKAGHMNQYDIMLSFGKAMSGAPIMSGMVKLPKSPARSGMITRKTMIEACIATSML